MKRSLLTNVVPVYRDIGESFLVIILFYCYLFQPPVVDKYIYIAVEIVISIFIFSFNPKVFNSFLRTFRTESILLFSIVFFSVIRDLFAGGEVYSFRFSAWAFQGFLFAFVIIYLLERRKYKNGKSTDVLSLVYWTAFVGAMLTFLLVVNKPFDDFYKSIQLDGYYELYEGFEQRYRAYGIAENLNFTYSYVLGFFAGYTLLVLKKNILLILPFFLFLIGVYFNARIGFAAIFFFLVYLVVIKKTLVDLVYAVVIGFLTIRLMIYSDSEIVSRIVSNEDWVMRAFYDVSDFFLGTQYNTEHSTLNRLFTDFLIFPDTISQWLVGRGESLFLKRGMNSDIGYILQLNYGGVFFLLVILFLMFFLSYRLYKVLGWRHWYANIFAFSIFVLNFKGFIFAATPGGRLFFFLYLYFILQSKLQKESESHMMSAESRMRRHSYIDS